MAKSKVSLGIELIGEEARLALVEVGERGLRLLSTQTVPSADDLPRVLRSLPRRPSTTVVSVTLEQSALRILNLPPTTEENLGRVVMLEAEGVLPLASDELALSHHVLGMTEQSRLEVLVAAARQSGVQQALRRANCLPWISATATVSAIACINTLQQLRGSAREGICAILKIEAHTSELLILDRNRVLVAQSLPIGSGGAEAPVEPPAAVAAGGGRDAQPLAGLVAPALPWVAHLAQQVRYAIQAVVYERGIALQRLYLCGAGAAQAGVDWHLSETLEIPVTPLAPDEADPKSALYSVAYGCALQAAGEAAMPLTLTLARITVAREVEQRRQSRLSWGALVGAAAVAAGLVGSAAFYRQQQAVNQAEARLAELKSVGVEKPTLPPGELKEAMDAVSASLQARVSPATALSALSQLLPERAWLTELNYNAATGCVVRGYTLDRNGAQRAQIALLGRALFDEVTLDYVTEEKLVGRPVWAFQLSGKLRPVEQNTRTLGGRGGNRQ